MSRNRRPFDPDLSHLHLTGRWAGFGFGRRGCLYTPENHELQPGDLAWLSLAANIRREWQSQMDAEKARRRPPERRDVIYLREVLAGARERVLRAL